MRGRQEERKRKAENRDNGGMAATSGKWRQQAQREEALA